MMSCSKQSATSVSDAPDIPELTPEEIEAISPKNIMDPMGIDPRYFDEDEIDIEKFRVETSGIKEKTSSTGFEINELPYVDSNNPYSQAHGINNTGKIVGYGYTGNLYSAVAWENGQVTTLQFLPNNYYDYAWADDVNDLGQAVGYSYTDNTYYYYYYHAVLWEADGTVVDLGTLPGGYYSYASGINNSGQVTGYSSSSNGERGFIWDATNGMVDMGTFGTAYSIYPQAINDSGVVVGYYYDNNGSGAFTWDASNGFTDLGSFGEPNNGYYSVYPRDINNNGQIVGDGYGFTNHDDGAFFYDPNTGYTSLDNDGDYNTYYYAQALNNNGIVVGYFYDYTNYYYYYNYSAFQWDEQNGIQDLGHLDANYNYYYSYTLAYDINDDAEVVGYSYNENGYNVAVIWNGDASGGSGQTNEAPVADAGADQTMDATGQTTPVTLDGSGSSDADGDALTYSWTLDGNEVSTDASFSTDLADGSYTFTLTVSDGEESDSDEVTVTVLNTVPVADAGADITLEATGSSTPVTLNGSGTDADGDALTYSWSNGSADATTDVDLGVGSHTFTLTVSDGQGASHSDEVTVTITDTTAPELTFSTETTNLWPPNHKMVLVLSGVQSVDIVDGIVEVDITVTSSEDDNGNGDGNTDDDYEIHNNPDGSYDVYLRAERSGNGDGRTYTISMTSIDAAGNVQRAQTVEASVPHDQGGGNPGKGGKGKN